MAAPRRRLATALAAGAFVAVAVTLAGRAVWLRAVPGAPHQGGWALQDFRDAVYWPIRALAAGDNPYDMPAYFGRYPVGQEFPLYAPHHLLLHAPFAALPYDAAEVVYFLLTLALTLVLARVSLIVHGRTTSVAAVCALAALLLASRPGHMNLLLGQVTLPLVLGATAALYGTRARPWLAAGGLALTLTKPTFGVPLALLLYCRGERRVVGMALALAGAVCLPVLALLVAHAGGVGAFVESVVANQSASSATTVVGRTTGWARIDAWPLLVRLLPSLPVGAQAPLGIAVLLLAAFAVRRHALLAPGRPGETTLLIAVATLACVYHQPYDLLLLAPPLVGLALALRDGRVTGRAPRVLCAVLLLPFVNYVASWTVLSRLPADAWQWHAIAVINPALLFAALLIGVAQVWQAPVAVPAATRPVRAPAVPS